MNAPALDVIKLEEITSRDPIALNMMDYIMDRKRNDSKMSILTLKREIEKTLKKQISDEDLMNTLKKLAAINAIGISKIQNLIKFRMDAKKLAKMALGEFKEEYEENKQIERLAQVKQKISKGETQMAAPQVKTPTDHNEELRKLATQNETALTLFTDLAELQREPAVSDISQRYFILKKENPDIDRQDYNEAYNKLSEMGYCIVIYGSSSVTRDRVFWKVKQRDLGRAALGENIPIRERSKADVDAEVREYTRDMGDKIKRAEGRFTAMHENSIRRSETNTPLIEPIMYQQNSKPSMGTMDHHAVTVEIPRSADIGEVLKWIEVGKQNLNLRISLK